MILALFAAAVLSAATADSGAGAPQSQAAAPPPRVTPPDWLAKPNAADLLSVWPRAQQDKGVGGKVVLDCVVNVRGLLEDCQVVSEEPAGGGFGGAALLLTPKFTMRPATRDGAPVRSTVSIPINFMARSPWGGRLERVTNLLHPIWLTAPTFAEVAAAYPKTGAHRDGRTVMRCSVEKDGRIDYCIVVFQQPYAAGFDVGALRLVKRFRVAMTPELARIFRLQVQITVRLPNPDGDDFKARRVLTPTWLAGPDQAFFARLPAPAAGAPSRPSTVRCVVAADGSLTACKDLSADPERFAEAVALAADTLKINLWTDEGDPVDGATLDFAIRFERAEPPVAATPKPTAP